MTGYSSMAMEIDRFHYGDGHLELFNWRYDSDE